MIDITTIKAGMIGVNGWKQSLLTDAPVIDATNLATTSGLLYNQDFSALVTVNNIVNVNEQSTLTDEQVNTLLTEIAESSASKVLNAVFNNDDFIQNDLLFSDEYDFQHPLTNDTSFVGYEIEVAKNKELLNIINRITATFDGIDTVKILLFHSSKKSPITAVEITTEADNEVNEDVTDFLMPYVNSINGGKWYLGYLRSGLTASAYNREFETANIYNTFYACGFESIIVTGHDTEVLFDVNDIEYSDKTWGLNFDISTFKNYNSVILRNKNKFSKALGLQVAAIVLDKITNTTESNRIERSTRQDAAIQLNGFVNENIKQVGILSKLAAEIKQLRKNFVGNPSIQIDTII